MAHERRLLDQLSRRVLERLPLTIAADGDCRKIEIDASRNDGEIILGQKKGPLFYFPVVDFRIYYIGDLVKFVESLGTDTQVRTLSSLWSGAGIVSLDIKKDRVTFYAKGRPSRADGMISMTLKQFAELLRLLKSLDVPPSA